MNRITKLFLVVVIELVLISFFLSFSEWSRLTSTVLFPPIIAITIYFFVIFSIDIERPKLTKTDFIFAFLLASVALVSAGMGFHYAANDINDEFLPFIGDGDIPTDVTDRLDYLDEKFSHMISLVGFIGVMIAIGAWYYIHRFKPLIENKIDTMQKSKTIDILIINFVSVFVGATLSLLSIESNMLLYGVIFFSLTSPIMLLKWRRHKPTEQGKDLLRAYWAFLAAYLGVALAYYLGTIGKLFTNIF